MDLKMEEEKIEIETELTFEDFFRNIYWETLRKTWFIWLIAVFLTPGLVYIVYLMLTTGKFSIFILFPAMPIIVVLFNIYSIYTSAKKNAESVRHRIFWSFSESGYETFTPIGKTESSWEGLEEIRESNKDFLLVPQKPLFIIIPKRFFTESQLMRFKQIVRFGLGDKAKLKG
jgi:YcxB-like protein